MNNFLFKHFFEFFEADRTISLLVYISIVPEKIYCFYNFEKKPNSKVKIQNNFEKKSNFWKKGTLKKLLDLKKKKEKKNQ